MGGWFLLTALGYTLSLSPSRLIGLVCQDFTPARSMFDSAFLPNLGVLHFEIRPVKAFKNHDAMRNPEKRKNKNKTPGMYARERGPEGHEACSTY